MYMYVCMYAIIYLCVWCYLYRWLGEQVYIVKRFAKNCLPKWRWLLAATFLKCKQEPMTPMGWRWRLSDYAFNRLVLLSLGNHLDQKVKWTRNVVAKWEGRDLQCRSCPELCFFGSLSMSQLELSSLFENYDNYVHAGLYVLQTARNYCKHVLVLQLDSVCSWRCFDCVGFHGRIGQVCKRHKA